jgi:hypothetical protein
METVQKNAGTLPMIVFSIENPDFGLFFSIFCFLVIGPASEVSRFSDPDLLSYL